MTQTSTKPTTPRDKPITRKRQAHLESQLNPTPWLYAPRDTNDKWAPEFWRSSTYIWTPCWLCTERVKLLAPFTDGATRIRLSGSKYDGLDAIKQECANYDEDEGIDEHDWEGNSMARSQAETFRTQEYAEWLRQFDCNPVYVTVEMYDEAIHGKA